MRRIVKENKDDCNVQLGDGKAVEVPELEVTLKDGARPILARPRQYAKEKREFLKQNVGALEKLELSRKVLVRLGFHPRSSCKKNRQRIFAAARIIEVLIWQQ